jgi:transposase
LTFDKQAILILEREDKDMLAITLSDSQKSKIMSFLRTCRGIYVGNEAKTLRFIEAIVWIVRSGAQGELLPESYGKWNSVYKRLARWSDRGIFDQMRTHCAADPDLEFLLLDSTIIRAHPCAAGVPSPDQEPKPDQALGRSRGGFSTKIHLIVDGLGNPLDFILTGGQVNDITQAPALLQGHHADYVIADKGYDSDAFIALIEQMAAIPVIPARKNRKEPRFYDLHIYKERHLVECCINKLKWFRRIFSRYDKLASRFKGFLSFVIALIWLR